MKDEGLMGGGVSSHGNHGNTQKGFGEADASLTGAVEFSHGKHGNTQKNLYEILYDCGIDEIGDGEEIGN